MHLLNSAILLYFSIWLLRAAFSRVRIECGPFMRWALFLGLVAAAVSIRMKGKSEITVDSFVQYLVFSVIFVLFLSSMQFKRTRARSIDMLHRIGRFFSEFSFTLYVLHIPLMAEFLQLATPVLGKGRLDPHQPVHLLVYLFLYIGLVVGAYLFHLPFEAKTYQVREWLKTILRFGARAAKA